MIKRFYVHNFRCLENFELSIAGKPSVLLIGKNGAGKTSVALALEILQKIGRGTNRVGDLLKRKDFSYGRTETPMRFEIEVQLDGISYTYSVAFELPAGFKEARVRDERFSVGGNPIYTRDLAQVTLFKTREDKEARFSIDWHLVAIPIIQASSQDHLHLFKLFLSRMLILRPIPSLINGESNRETLEPDLAVTNFGEWFSGLLAEMPSAYKRLEKYLKEVMPDLLEIKNPVVAMNARSLIVQFADGEATVDIPFGDLSDGEKCFMICGLVLAENHGAKSLLCFWDEPDSYLAPNEVGFFVSALRQAFESKGQLIATSQNLEAILGFTGHNTLVLQRRTHLSPTVIKVLADMNVHGNLADAILKGDLEE